MNTKVFRFVVASVLSCMVAMTQAQTVDSDKSNGEGLNLAKFNVLPLLGGKFAFEYERLVANRISVGATISLRPNKGLPFGSTIKSVVDDEDINNLIDGFSTSNFSFTPEARFYTSKKGPFRGFYIAPYAKFASYKASLPFDFEVDAGEVYSREETIPLSGNVSSFTAGLSFGVNFKLSKQFYLDWRIFGPGYGSAKGKVSGRMDLDANEQAELRESLDDLRESLGDLPLGIKIEHEVNSEGAEVRILRSPWAGIRTGLSVAYRF